MSVPRSEIIRSHPIGNGLDYFRSCYTSQWRDKANLIIEREDLRQILIALFLSLQSLSAAQVLPSRRGHRGLLNDLLSLYSSVVSDSFNAARLKLLLDTVLDGQPDEAIWNAVYDAVAESTPPTSFFQSSFQQTPWLHHTGSFTNSSEHRKYVDDVLKRELGQLYIGLPDFFEAYFGSIPGLTSAAQAVFEQCKEGDTPLYQAASGWQGWPKDARESDVLGWLVSLIDQLVGFAAQTDSASEQNELVSRPRRRPLAQPNKPIEGSTADRKLDVGFIDDPHAGADAKYSWSQILVPGELKSNPLADRSSKAWLDLGRYAREVLAAQDSRRFVLGFTLCGSRMRLWEFDRLGGIASESFDVNEDALQFVSSVLGFLWLNKEQLGFDPTIITDGGKRYIDVSRNGCTERLIIDRVMKRTRCVAGRATTCWRAHRDGVEPRVLLVIKDSWQYAQRDEEGKLLREATEKGVVNVARHYHHETVWVNGQIDDIRENVRRGLLVTKAQNYKPEGPMSPSKMIGRPRTDQNTGAAGTKRPSSATDAPLPPSKRSFSSSPVKGGKALANRIHRRVVLRDLGAPIYMASSPAKLLAALEGCIEGYESLQMKAGLLQSDISPNNLMINEDKENPSWPAFIIDLDLAVREQRETSSGAHGKTGTRAFMAIGILLDDETHSFMHDLESFFWVLFWICVHYDGPGKDIGPTEFESWNYESDKKLAGSKKSMIDDEGDFLKAAKENFTPYHQILITCVNRLRRRVFPDGKRWKSPNPMLGSEMRAILRTAQDDLKNQASEQD